MSDGALKDVYVHARAGLMKRNAGAGEVGSHCCNFSRVTDEQHMFVDLFYACEEAFLITKVLPLGHTMVTALDKTDTTSLKRVHLGTYGKRYNFFILR